MTKRFISAILSVILVIAIVPMLDITSSAAVTYDRSKTLQYAQNHWNDGKGLCAEFVSDCLAAGGLTKSYQKTVSSLYNALIQCGYGESQKLTINGKYVQMSENTGKVKAGDPIFYYCNSCKDFLHAALCNGADSDGYLVEYAHNSAHDGKTKVYTFSHCGSYNITIYSISLMNTPIAKDVKKVLHGKKTGIKAPEIISSLNLSDGVYFRWNKISNASYYKIYRKTKTTGWKFIANTTDVVYTDNTVVNGKTYSYTVRACDGGTYSPYYDGLTTTYLMVTKFTDAVKTSKGIKLSWDINLNAEGYKIYRAVNDGMWEEIADIDSRLTSTYTDKNVKNGKSYEYRIRSYKKDIVSSYDVNGISVA